MKKLILANVIIYIIIMFFAPELFKYFAIYPITDSNFAIWQPLTSMFLHGNFMHIFFNMIVLFSFGIELEKRLGSKMFFQLYFASGIFSAIFWMLGGIGAAVGSSGAICGLIAAYIFIEPNSKVLLFFIIPIKLKSFVYGFAIFSAIFSILFLINPKYGFGLGHIVHLGGLITGYFLTLYWKKYNKISYLEQ